MQDINQIIEEKLKSYPPNVQQIARNAISLARRLDARMLATQLENQVLRMAREERNK